MTPWPDLFLSGLVYDALGGPASPIAGAVVSARACVTEAHQTFTDALGRFTLHVPGVDIAPCARITLYGWASGYLSYEEAFAAVDLYADPERDIAMHITGLGTATPSATPSPSPMPGWLSQVLLLPLVGRQDAPAMATATSTPTNSLTPSSTPILPQQLIQNPSFETDDAWQILQTVYPASYSRSRAHSGVRSMRLGLALGGGMFSYSSVQQQVSLPARLQRADLSFYYFPLMSGDAEDSLYFCILQAADDAILECDFWTDAAQAWVHGARDLRSYAGQTVKLHWGVRNDGLAGASAAYLDDVELGVR